MARYRLLVGGHTDKDPAGKTPDNPTGSKWYEPGAIIESDEDLCFSFNCPGKLPKFERLQDIGQDLPLPDNYWDESKETWEQFEGRMRAKMQARKDAASKPPEGGRVPEQPKQPQPQQAGGGKR